jgi:hypothetical protein
VSGYIRPMGLPLSVAFFSLSRFHRRTSSSVTTLLTSSSVASRPSLTHWGSRHPTRVVSPSAIYRLQPSLRQARQKMWPQFDCRHRDPFTVSKHTLQECDAKSNFEVWDLLSYAVKKGSNSCGAACGILVNVITNNDPISLRDAP